MTYKEEKEFGKDFSIFGKVEGPSLSKVMRSGDDIIDVATQLREENQVPKKSKGGYSICRSETPGIDCVQGYLDDQDDHILITWRNQLRMQANKLIRRKLGHRGVLPNPGEPVLVCKNNEVVLNGEIHFADVFSDGPSIGPEVKTKQFRTDGGIMILANTQGKSEPMDGFMPDVKDWKAFHAQLREAKVPDPIPVTYGYVSTAHKAQGSEYRRVSIFLSAYDLQSKHFTAPTTLPNGEKMPFATRWLYTSLTRAKTRVSLILGN
ncbi:unnamed protein product [marine sediment metagenome]|uniref:Uncharacterized protein n=1 Tax=marine sediment metagenome TaxID=412755 RepID=X0VDD6_9ZZZZ